MKKKYKILIYSLTLIIFGLILTYCCMVCKEEDTGTYDIDNNVYDTVNVSGNSVPIDSTATVYKFSSGLKLIVPPGAVKENVTVSFELLDSISAGQIIPLDVFAGKVFCAGISFGQTGTKFLKPITIRVPALRYTYNDIPSVYLYNSVSSSLTQFTGPLSCSENEHFIEFSTDTPLSARIELFKDVLGFGKSDTKSTKGDPIDCHKILVKIKIEDYDYISTGGCDIQKQTLKVEFTACTGSPIETAEVRLIKKACEPIVICTPDKNCLDKNESATLNFIVTVGGLPLSDQQIYITLPTGLSSTQNPVFATDVDGKAEFKVTCNVDNFTSGTINYDVHIQYYLEIINASAEGRTENTENYQQSKEKHDAVTIRSCANKVTSVELHSDQVVDGDGEIRGEIYHLSCDCYNGSGAKIDCGEVVYSIASSYPTAGAVSVDPSSGVVTCNNPGAAEIQAMASGIVSKYNAFFTVAYEGDLNLSGVTDHNIYYGCGCKEDYNNPLTDYKYSWYVVTWTVKNHFHFWLSKLNEAPFGDISGENSYDYKINSNSLCKNATFIEPVDGFDFSWVGWEFSSIPTQLAILGHEFPVDYSYFDYRGWGYLQDIQLDLKLIDGGFNAHVHYFWPHGCVLRINDIPDFQLK
jgi:hypothetical protein